MQVMFDTISSSFAHIKAGKLRALAMTSVTRSDVLPDVPMIADTVPGYGLLTRRDRTGRLGRRDSNLCILDCNSPKTPSQGARIRTSASWNRDLSSGTVPELAYLELQVLRLHSQKTSQASDRRPSPLSHDEVHQN